MILKHVEEAKKVLSVFPKDKEAMEELDKLLLEGAEKAWSEFQELYPDVVVSEEGIQELA